MGADGEATSAVSRPGNRDDFDRLYRENYPRLLRTLYAITGDAAAAEDCVQEAFVKAWRAWPRFRPERAPEGWLHQIAVNTAISYRRRAKLRSVGEILRRLGRPGAGTDPGGRKSTSQTFERRTTSSTSSRLCNWSNSARRFRAGVTQNSARARLSPRL